MQSTDIIDWKTGVYQAPEAATQGESSRITVASDWGALWDYAPLIERDPLAVYGDLLPLLRDGDLNLVNVECALGQSGEAIKKAGPALRAPADAVQSLAQAPFHVACLANNHIMDFGPQSLEETVGVLRDAGLRTVGAATSGEAAREPLRMQMKGVSLGIINCAEGEACASIQNGPGANPFDVAAIQEQIQQLRREVEVVLVIFHGGREHAPVPPVYVVEALRRFAEAGAAAVVAHHPHVPQGLEIHRGTPIVYSQGNFVFRSADTCKWRSYFRSVGYLTHLDFAGEKLIRFSITPYQMKSDGVFQLRGEEKAHLLQCLQRVSQVLSNREATQQAWDAFVDSKGAAELQNVPRRLLNQFEEDAPLASARLHNLFLAPAHRELYLNGFRRIANGEIGNSPQWAKDLVQEWQS